MRVVDCNDHTVPSGRFRVNASSEGGREVVLAEYGPGEYFVEIIVPSTCCVVHRAELHQFLADHPDFALHLAHKLIRMVRVVTEQVKSLALQNVHGRLVRVLTELSDPVGDVRVVRQKLTQQDIADRIGSSRERVNRVMKELAAGGYLSGHHGRYTIHRKFPPGW